MTVAQSRLAEFVAWLNLSSAQRKSPLGDKINVGRYAVIVPWDLSEPPRTDFASEALPLYVPTEQAEGVSTGPVAIDAPASQDHVDKRLAHILWKIGEGLPPMAVIGLDDPAEVISEAAQRAGADGVDLSAYPLLAAPLWALSATQRAEIETKLPVLP